MTVQGVIIVDLIAVVLLLWVLSLVRRGRMYVGYGAMFVVLATAVIAALSIPGLLDLLTGLVGAVFPASALALIALAFMSFLFVYVLSQLTILANRVATLVQELAIRQATHDAAGVRTPTAPDGRDRSP